MRSRWKKISILCGITGLCCLIAAGLIAVYNMIDDSRAAREVKAETEMLEAIVLSPERVKAREQKTQQDAVKLREQSADPIRVITTDPTATPASTPDSGGPVPDPKPEPNPDPTRIPVATPTPAPTPLPDLMPVVTIDGWDFVAIISIPALDLELAVRNEWSKPAGEKSPCRYVGSVYTNDLIICAHNYTAHFGRLKELKKGDKVILVDMNGEVYTYHVERVDKIGKFDTEGMVSSDYDLSLFTCTIGGKARVTVRCTRDT